MTTTPLYLPRDPGFNPELWDDDVHGWVVAEKSGLQVAVLPFMFTAGIVIGRLTFTNYYQDRWCYHSPHAAMAAALAWEGEWPDTEPAGWHRHPLTGRRRVDGDPARESITL